MMANWDKLNKEFNNLIDSMSKKDWEIWADNRESKKLMRALEMQLKAKLQEDRILLSNIKGLELLNQTELSSEYTNINISSLTGIDYPVEPTYALAA